MRTVGENDRSKKAVGVTAKQAERAVWKWQRPEPRSLGDKPLGRKSGRLTVRGNDDE